MNPLDLPEEHVAQRLALAREAELGRIHSARIEKDGRSDRARAAD